MRTSPQFSLVGPLEQMREATRLLSTTGLVSGESWRCRSLLSPLRKETFEAGGIRVEGNDGFDSARDCVEAFSASGCTVACICSSTRSTLNSVPKWLVSCVLLALSNIYLAGSPDLGENLDGEIDDCVILVATC